MTSLSPLLLALALSACGGGGGDAGGGADPAPGFSVAIDRAELRFAGDEGAAIAAQVVTGAGTGTNPPSTIYVGGQDLGTSLDQVTARVVGTEVKFYVAPKAQLAAGEYKGKLKLFACADEPCTKHLKGSPAEVPYTVTVAKGLKVTPATVQLAAIAGRTAATTVGVALPKGVTSFTAAPNVDWLKVSNVTASGFTVTAAVKAPGEYTGSVSVSAGDRNTTAFVTYKSTADQSALAVITPDKPSLSFSAPAGDAAPSQVVQVKLPAWASGLTATAGADAAGWLKVVTGMGGKVTVTASAEKLAVGSYATTLMLNAAEANPVSIPIALNVFQAEWDIAGTSVITADGASTAARLVGDLAIDVPSLPVQGWRASTTASWLKLTRASGSTRTHHLALAVDAAEMAKLANFATHTAEVLVSLESGKMTPAKVTVTLDKKLPELHYVSPATRLPAEGGKFALRGRGFAAIANLSTALTTAGATPSAVTRVSDTQIDVTVPPAPSGNATFTLTNALGSKTAPVALKVVPQDAIADAVVKTEGLKAGLVFDAQRQSLYTVNMALGSLMRFRRNGATWDVGSVPVTGADAVTMSPDGKSLVVTATPDRVVLIDPATLAIQDTYKAGSIAGNINNLPRAAMRSDGKMFFAGSSGTGTGMAYFDLPTRTFGSTGDGLVFGWGIASGDGSRIQVVQSSSYTPAPPTLRIDAGAAAAVRNPDQLTFWYKGAQSLRGERFVEDVFEVWDRDLNIIGKVQLPDPGFYGIEPVFSPDGARLYLLAYEASGSGAVGGQPRVYVFDTSKRMVTSTNLPVLGAFDLPEFPTCTESGFECQRAPRGAISPDGKTLFFVGDRNLVVAAIPAMTSGAQPLMQRVRLQPAAR